MQDMPVAPYDLIKPNRYVNRTFIQTSRGCHHACTFCAEQLMYGLRFRYRPVDEVMREIDATGARTFAFNDADFFGTPSRAAEVMQGLKGRGVSWQAGVNFAAAFDDRLLELAAESGCNMLAIGFEVAVPRNAAQGAQIPEHAGTLPGSRREAAQPRHPGLRPVHVRLRPGRAQRLRGDRPLRDRRGLRRLRLLDHDALSRHAELVRDADRTAGSLRATGTPTTSIMSSTSRSD